MCFESVSIASSSVVDINLSERMNSIYGYMCVFACIDVATL